MLQNLLIVALRNLRKYKIFSLLNIAGLGLGLTAFIFIVEYTSFERSVDAFHRNRADLYRVLYSDAERSYSSASINGGLGPAAQENFPEVRAFCRIGPVEGIVQVESGATQAASAVFEEKKGAYAENTFFEMFSFPLLEGSADQVLARPNTVVLSATCARKYFGTSPALGRTLTLNNQFGSTRYTVTGVCKDFPANSDFQFDLVYSLETMQSKANLHGNNWFDLQGFDSNFISTYLLLASNADQRTLEEKLQALKKSKSPATKSVVYLQPFRYVHLAANTDDFLISNGELRYVLLFGGLALLILVIAWFNYINLSTAIALQRAREVGVRKAIGATRGQLWRQFMSESLLLHTAGFALALGLVYAFQKALNTVFDKALTFNPWQHPQTWLWGLGLALGGALLSGAYVASVATAFAPVEALSKAVATGQGMWRRKGLVIFQFAISVFLIAVTLLFHKQLQFMQNEQLGVALAQKVIVRGPRVTDASYAERSKAFRQEIGELSFVRDYCSTATIPGQWYNWSQDGIVPLQNPSPEAKDITYSMARIDERYIPVYQIQLLAGQNFDQTTCEMPSDKVDKIIVNESAARLLGFATPEQAVLQKVNIDEAQPRPHEIIGVVRDYHHLGLQQKIDPIIFLPSPSNDYLTVQFASNEQLTQNIEAIRQRYLAMYPGNPFDFFFADEHFGEQYAAEQRYSALFTLAAGLAIFIACLGLFGLTSFIAMRRTKEIGIRKVLGASVTGLLGLLTRDFLKLVLLAIVIASPIAWYFMQRWLADFAYRIDIQWWMFALAGLLAVGIAFLTVSFQSVKAALADPVKSLRSE